MLIFSQSNHWKISNYGTLVALDEPLHSANEHAIPQIISSTKTVPCIMKYSKPNLPALSDFGKIHNYMIIHDVILFRDFNSRASKC